MNSTGTSTWPGALGVLYRKEGVKTFEEQLHIYREDKTPVVHRKRDMGQVNALLARGGDPA
ncbi:hypothetical protein [Anaerotalea alkaliphila]|uniref:Uncharacterized protein n=1 Tax=Anaerotalea alkaliphila TaxID=2662126 RepID=A0A7X5HXA3_9FIRM|nr:hypothetical protein [Anaerotalea alkaliphila]NDL68310.1 hypothetical protein [Anaerotalea alkaliphila]